jgi:hypothetical protein
MDTECYKENPSYISWKQKSERGNSFTEGPRHRGKDDTQQQQNEQNVSESKDSSVLPKL